MGLFDWFRRPKARTISASPDVAGAAFSARGPARRGSRELIEAYREQPWLRAVTGRIGAGVASAGWCIYARAEAPSGRRDFALVDRAAPAGRVRDVVGAPVWAWGADRAVYDARLNSPDFSTRAARRVELARAGLLREIADHPLLTLLASPNNELTGRKCIQMTQTWLDIKGEAFWLLRRGELGQPIGYFPLPPHWVSRLPTAAKPTFQVGWGTLQIEVPATEMVWFKDPDPANPYGRGTGVGEALGDELETDEFAAKYLKNWFFNSGIPSLLVSFEGANKEQLTLVKEKWEAEHRGYHNAHKAHFASGKMNAVRLDASFRDQQIADLRRLSRDFTAQVFAMPPEMIGIIENSNRATISAARYIYALGVEFPRCESLRAELQQQLVPLFDANAVIECEVAIPDDEQRRLDVFRAMPGAFSLNEWRSEAGYAPLPEFDGVFPPLAMPGQNPADGSPTPADNEEPDDAAEPEAEDEESPAPPPPEEPRTLPEPPWVNGPIR